ncbi:hypothetical protein [Leifsonia sp. fls2-241-R2A-40a]|uniref:hypothetical protein n=1 Tax=Leifsonia sp. fls2-241-R2A-40a TaxID=3040290 RepID=UPI00254B25EB|nr:hypothetical protein [Leifsonia sp. fls2-241-R2A-40a]
MWDTTTRIPFEASLLSERSDIKGRASLLRTIAAHPGITVDELNDLRLPGLFADLRSLHRAGVIHASTTPPRFFERTTRVFPFGE